MNLIILIGYEKRSNRCEIQQINGILPIINIDEKNEQSIWKYMNWIVDNRLFIS